MRYFELGHSGVKVSQLTLGGMSFGKASENFHLWTVDQDTTTAIIRRALDLGVAMSTVALAWHWAHGSSSPIVGCSSPERVEQAVAATSIELSDEDVTYLEEPYTAHELVGPLARPGEKERGGTWQPPTKPHVMR